MDTQTIYCSIQLQTRSHAEQSELHFRGGSGRDEVESRLHPGYHGDVAGPGCSAPRASRPRPCARGAPFTVIPGVGLTPHRARVTAHSTSVCTPHFLPRVRPHTKCAEYKYKLKIQEPLAVPLVVLDAEHVDADPPRREAGARRWLLSHLPRLLEEARLTRGVIAGDMPKVEAFRERLASFEDI